MRSHPFVYVVVLNWNAWPVTLRCLSSLTGLAYPNYGVVVVDNGSEDGSEARIRVASPETELLQTGSNRGYAGGNNVGIRHAIDRGADVVWVLNNDTQVEPNALGELVAAVAAHPRRGAAASRLRSSDRSEAEPNVWLLDGERHVPVECEGCEHGFHRGDVVSGASLLIRRNALEQVGLFDESYFHYYEEVDLMERLRRMNWTAGLACRSVVVHEHGASLRRSAQSHYYFVRNRLLYRRKLFGEHPLGILRDKVQLGSALRLRQAAVTRDLRPTIAGLRAIVDATKGKSGQRELGGRYLRHVT